MRKDRERRTKQQRLLRYLGSGPYLLLRTEYKTVIGVTIMVALPPGLVPQKTDLVKESHISSGNSRKRWRTGGKKNARNSKKNVPRKKVGKSDPGQITTHSCPCGNWPDRES